ncbi:TIGR02678 family protein [Anaeromyxobacter dehalogenans]|uniref:TIGR02678 family protein n=1 Tax=Anaeromyxobacter dehalogenans (strain 2CP-C) TaxID=290397 RepID=Q2IGC2_ANADE|nr:TIGR02678 family protein [Anaeromyxobacter dehalogenans]ABC83627.1 conserved hypothetical protein [Anaeromyxobacter dehalogenans 2CP-C]
MTPVCLRDERALAERRSALRVLLARPLLVADQDPETFASVVRHRGELARWFADHAGWTLVVDAGGRHARLLKRPVRPDPTRPAGAPGKGPFDRRRYVLFSLALAALDGEGAQVTLARLAERVRELSLEDVALAPFDPESSTERHAFVDVLRLLGELGVVVFKDGDAERYVRDRASGDALYDVRERLLARLLSAPRPPALAANAAHMAEEERAGTEEGDRAAGRHEVFRRLLDDPVAYRDDLSPRAREWLAAGSGFLYERLERDAGLVVERRAEGLAAIDTSGALADTAFPDGGSTVKHAALLLCEWLADEAREGRRLHPAQPPPGVLWRAVVARIQVLQAEHAGRWSKEFDRSDAGAEALAREAVRLLVGFGLAAMLPDGGVVARPAAARFAPRETMTGGRP